MEDHKTNRRRTCRADTALILTTLLSSCVLHSEPTNKTVQYAEEPCFLCEQSWAQPEQPSTEPVFVVRSRNVLIVGDSEACAVGNVAQRTSDEVGWGHVIDTSCKSGSTIQDWSGNRIDTTLKNHDRSDAVIVFLGGNNVHNENTAGAETIVQKITAHRSSCVWVGNARLFDKTWRINSSLKEVVEASGCRYLDSELLNLKLVDKMHPDVESAKLWFKSAIALVPVLYEELEVR